MGINKTYDVSVRAKFGNDWSNYGSSCQISSPANPVTQITASNCGMQTSTFGQLFYADYMTGATQYEFEFIESGQPPITDVRATYSESFTHAGISGINRTFDVRVRAMFGGVWGNYGSSCQIKLRHL